ncbi:MAG: thioredoxin family protein [Coriobacteriia bacterium]|nr:thioredoxin family protein [Coriobacteriia bacterium]
MKYLKIAPWVLGVILLGLVGYLLMTSGKNATSTTNGTAGSAAVRVNDTSALSDSMMAPKNGVPVMVEFSATWCSVCKAAKPDIDALTQKYKGKVEVRIFECDENAAAQALFDKLGGTGYPEYYFIDSSGTLQQHMVGFEGKDAIDASLAALK